MSKFLDIFRSFVPDLDVVSSFSPNSFLQPGWLFGIMGVVVIIVFSLSLGRTKTVISLISVYIAFVISKIFPFQAELSNLAIPVEDFWLEVGIFLICYAVIFIVLNFSFIKKRLSSSEYSIFGIILLSILQFGLIISILFNIIPAQLSAKLFSGPSFIFSSPIALFLWAIAPLPILFFIRK